MLVLKGDAGRVDFTVSWNIDGDLVLEQQGVHDKTRFYLTKDQQEELLRILYERWKGV